MPDIYQNFAGYRPPSVYVTRVKEIVPQPAGVVKQVPLIIGRGPAIKKIEAVIVRSGSGEFDVLPSTQVLSVTAVGNRRNVVSYSNGVDYRLTSGNRIEWLTANKPAAGASYYVYYKARPEASQYEMKRILLSDRILLDTHYGEDLMEYETYTFSTQKTGTGAFVVGTLTYDMFDDVDFNANQTVGYCELKDGDDRTYVRDEDYIVNDNGLLEFLEEGNKPNSETTLTATYKVATPVTTLVPNPVYLGAKIAFDEGATEVFCLQVMPTGTPVDYMHDVMPDPYGLNTSDWTEALDTYVQYEVDIHRIVPMTNDLSVFEEIEVRMAADSQIEEARPRTTLLPIYWDYTDADMPSAFDVMYSKILTELGKHRTSRICVPFPFSAYKTLSDGNEYLLPSEYIAAALAGQEAGTKKQFSLNNHNLSSFNRLGIMRLTKNQMNKIGAAGAVVLQQQRLSDPIVIRDWITTDRTDAQSEEPSIQNVYDYAWLSYINAITPYLKDHVVNASLIQNIKDTLILENEKMGSSGMGLFDRAEVVTVAQDTAEPRKVYARIRLYMLYPAKYFDIEVVTQ
jgi:hypothetical protein